jgi:O-antigen ligase
VNTFLERVSLFLLLILATGAGIGVFVGQDSSGAATSGGQPVIQLLFGLFYIVFFVFVAVQFKSAWPLILQEKWIAALCILAVISMLWSIDSTETLRKGLAILGSSMVGLCIAIKYEPKQLLRIVATCLGVCAIASLVVALFIPSIGVMPEGAWQGVFYLKNTLGRMMSLGVVCFALLAVEQRRYRMISVGMIALCSVLLFMSKSITGVVVALLMLLILAFRRTLLWPIRRLAAFLIASSLVVGSLALWAYESRDAILQAIGRESTLTGRLPLWHYVKQDILLKPMLGYGFSAFWSGSEAARIQAVITWDAPNAHNGFLEVLLGLGVVGLFFLVASLLANLIRSVRSIRERGDFEESFPFFFLVFLVFYSLTESSLLAVNSILWMLYSANSYWLVRDRLRPEAVSDEETDSPNAGYSSVLQSGAVS